jgi:hypothetical protein
MSMQRLDDVRHIFPKHEDNFVDVNEVLHPIREKMDACMAIVLCYASLSSENPTIKPSDCKFNILIYKVANYIWKILND